MMVKPRFPNELEAQFQSWVVDLAHYTGWKIAHFRPARAGTDGWRTPVQYDAKGWPDLVLSRPGETIFVELKTERGVLSDEQKMWIDLLSSAGLEVHVWRPVCRPEIEARLKRVVS